MIRTLYSLPITDLSISSNLLAIPKKYGPSISYTSTPSGICSFSSLLIATSVLSPGSISSWNERITVASLVRFKNSAIDATRPNSIAIVKSKITVKRNVMISTAKSDLGFFASILNVRQPLMLYDTMISTAARHGIGIKPTNLPNRSSTRSSTTA